MGRGDPRFALQGSHREPLAIARTVLTRSQPSRPLRRRLDVVLFSRRASYGSSRGCQPPPGSLGCDVANTKQALANKEEIRQPGSGLDAAGNTTRLVEHDLKPRSEGQTEETKKPSNILQEFEGLNLRRAIRSGLLSRLRRGVSGELQIGLVALPGTSHEHVLAAFDEILSAIPRTELG
jgi:hypothetical protein